MINVFFKGGIYKVLKNTHKNYICAAGCPLAVHFMVTDSSLPSNTDMNIDEPSRFESQLLLDQSFINVVKPEGPDPTRPDLTRPDPQVVLFLFLLQ